MTEERKYKITIDIGNKSKKDLLALLELYLMNPTNNHTEEYEYVLHVIKLEIFSRMSH